MALIRASAPPVVVSAAGTVLWSISIRSMSVTGSEERLLIYIMLAVVGAVVYFLGLLAQLIVMGGASRNLVMHLLWGEPVTARLIYRSVRSRFWGLLLATLAVVLWLVMSLAMSWVALFVAILLIVVVVLISAGVGVPWLTAILSVVLYLGALVLMLLVFFYAAGRVAYGPQVLMFEGGGGVDSTSRSFRRASTRRSRRPSRRRSRSARARRRISPAPSSTFDGGRRAAQERHLAMRATLKRVAPCLLASLLTFVAAAAKGAPTGRANARDAATPATLAQYRERVRGAVAPLEELAAFCEQLSKDEKPEVWSKEGFDPDVALEFPKRSRDALGRVRALLPPKEKVVLDGGGSIEVDNSWLQSALQEFERAGDNDKRARSLRSTAERLRALDARLAETERVNRTQDKDAERGRLNAILRDPEFNRQSQRGNALQRLIEQVVEWIKDLLRKIFPGGGALKPGTNPRVSQLAQIVVLALCLAVVAYVAWFVWSRRKRELKTLKLKRRARVVLGERLEADQTSADLLSDAERLPRAGDLRGAIRKAYVALLCELGDRQVIRLSRHKTNRDYLSAVRRSDRPRLYTEMLPLTFNFELHWYGLHDASETDWDDFSARCRQALKVI